MKVDVLGNGDEEELLENDELRTNFINGWDYLKSESCKTYKKGRI